MSCLLRGNGVCFCFGLDFGSSSYCFRKYVDQPALLLELSLSLLAVAGKMVCKIVSLKYRLLSVIRHARVEL